MIFHNLRRLTADNNHNMDTGIRWFRDALYVAYRQGDAHVSPNGKLVVQRSRDGGVTYEVVQVARGEVDTRDAHLYTVEDRRLHLVGFESAHVRISGTTWTENGLNWSPWTRFTGADGWWLWHPEYYRGRYYCAGYGNWDTPGFSSVAWFESDNGIDWRQVRLLREGADQPNECSLAFAPDGAATLLMRREFRAKTPLLLRAKPPYAEWTAVEIPVPLHGPNLWFVEDDLYIAGRWFVSPMIAHQAVFKLEAGDRPALQVVLPSGPQCDLGYMSATQWPTNRRRFSLAYYSNHNAPPDPHLDQWSHPDIYVAEVLFDAAFIRHWRVSDLVEAPRGLQDAACPDPDAPGLAWRPMTATPDDIDEWSSPGLVDAHELIAGQPGLVYFVADLEVGPTEGGFLHLGYDGPVRAWVNGEQVFEGPGSNPAVADATTVRIATRHGANRLAIALDTHGGKAWGVMARYEVA